MKKCLVPFVLLFLVMAATASSASQPAADKKTTSSKAHNKQDKANCCCDMKCANGSPKASNNKMNSKKDPNKKGSEAK
ncbi:MAG: hypothetical protein WBZ48_01020 [Bacteroidota bacterium]